VVGGKGWEQGDIGRVVNYNVATMTGSRDFVGVYGWMQNPLTEYYVAEMGGVANMSPITSTVMVNGRPQQQIVSFTANGNRYYMYEHYQVDQPSIEGQHSNFWQYENQWGGSGIGSNHSVTMSTHIYYWNQQRGSRFGSSYNYMVFGVEAYSGKSGTFGATVW
jgi:endo-1,4-beta-xylanase